MKKEIYIQPTIKPIHIKPAAIICGSGDQTGALPSGSTGVEPTPIDGIITGEAKPAFGFDFSEEE